MAYDSLRAFLATLEADGELVRVSEPVSTVLEMTEIHRRLLARSGPAVLFENPLKADGSPSPFPTLINLFGTVRRVAMGVTLGGKKRGNARDLREVGELLAFLRQPEPPAGLRDAVNLLPLARTVMQMRPKTIGPLAKAPCQEVVYTGDEVDLNMLPIQTCWPGEPAPLITWPLVVTQGPTRARAKSAQKPSNSAQNSAPESANREAEGDKGRPGRREGDKPSHIPSDDNSPEPDDKTAGAARADIVNLGIYRMQVLAKNKTVMRWLKHRGGAQHHARWKDARPDPLPAAAVIGADPGTILAAVTPVPDTLSEYQFAGLLRGRKVELVDCETIPLKVPATAEIVIEGHVALDEYADEGPYGDHTGYYNSVERFPVFHVSAITMRKDPIYLTTFTGRPPDEPSVLGEALNEVFIPLLQQQFPEITDFWLPPEGCSYRIAVISMKKAYPGHAKRVMMGAWSYLRQFMYTKWLIVVDDDINARDWKDVMWAVSTRMDPARDISMIENTPIDYLDFASPESGLGSKIALDATNKMGAETKREWGRKLEMDAETMRRVDEVWGKLGL